MLVTSQMFCSLTGVPVVSKRKIDPYSINCTSSEEAFESKLVTSAIVNFDAANVDALLEEYLSLQNRLGHDLVVVLFRVLHVLLVLTTQVLCR
jgi:hypothetical protein